MFVKSGRNIAIANTKFNKKQFAKQIKYPCKPCYFWFPSVDMTSAYKTYL